MGKSRNFMLTMNNPKLTLQEFSDLLCKDSVYSRCQLEKGENGTPHIQACVGYKNPVHFKSIAKKFTGCHVEVARNALASWNYCGKEDTRLEAPISTGIPPASRAVKGATKERNKMILEHGLTKAVEDGLIDITRYA